MMIDESPLRGVLAPVVNSVVAFSAMSSVTRFARCGAEIALEATRRLEVDVDHPSLQGVNAAKKAREVRSSL